MINIFKNAISKFNLAKDGHYIKRVFSKIAKSIYCVKNKFSSVANKFTIIKEQI